MEETTTLPISSAATTSAGRLKKATGSVAARPDCFIQLSSAAGLEFAS
jgi:hypothetical protein